MLPSNCDCEVTLLMRAGRSDGQIDSAREPTKRTINPFIVNDGWLVEVAGNVHNTHHNTKRDTQGGYR
jgi:hypothetical protein